MFTRHIHKNNKEYSTGLLYNTIETPAPIIQTYLGNLLDLMITSNLDLDASSLKPMLGQINIHDLYSKEFENLSIKELQNVKNDIVLILSSRHMINDKEHMNQFEGNCIKLDTHRGLKLLSVVDYIQRIELDRPRIIITMADEVSMNDRKKRVSKSIERTMSWFDQYIASNIDNRNNKHSNSTSTISSSSRNNTYNNNSIVHSTTTSEQVTTQPLLFDNHYSSNYTPCVFGVAQYNPNYKSQLALLIDNMLSKGAQGIVIGSLYLGETPQQRTEAVQAVKGLLRKHPRLSGNASNNIPTAIQGVTSFSQLIESLELGVDLVSTNYPQILSSKGNALLLLLNNLQHNNNNNTIDNHNNIDNNNNGSNNDNNNKSDYKSKVQEDTLSRSPHKPYKRPRVSHKDKSIDNTSTSLDTVIVNNNNIDNDDNNSKATITNNNNDSSSMYSEINLWDPVYCKDARPLLPSPIDCNCQVCQLGYSRAYIHHLLICKEMLADTLLYHHNQYQVLLLFDQARKQIRNNTFDQWIASMSSNNSYR